LTSTPVATFTYDGNGNTLTKVNSTGTTQYTWDFENRLGSVMLPGPGGTVTFKYDPFGRRIQKSSSAGTTDYLYDGSDSVEEVDQSGALLARYAQSAGIDEPLAESRGGTNGFYEQDGLGSVTSLSGSAGALADTYTYDAFGVLTASTGTLANPFQYTGRDYDSETGLRYYRARYYDSTASRFLSEDPLGFGVGGNFYAYVDNDPADFTDPLGLCPPQKRKKSECTLSVNFTFGLPVNPTVEQNTRSTLIAMFGPEVGLEFSTANPNADLNLTVSSIVPEGSDEPGVMGYATSNPNGKNSGVVDLGKLIAAQGPYGGKGNAALGRGIGQVAAHELGHELLLSHNGLGEGIMAARINPFLPNGFTDANKVNILGRCKYLRSLKQKK